MTLYAFIGRGSNNFEGKRHALNLSFYSICKKPIKLIITI